jgi:formylglycine-generating enzyme required for sulfatase activity
VEKLTKELLPERKVLQCHDGYTVTAPVGSFLPNAFGLYDMLGNVWEFCEDVYVQEIYAERNQETPVDNPLATSGGEAPVRRGGGWYRHWSNVRCASRGYELQTCVNPNMGIRLVRIN